MFLFLAKCNSLNQIVISLQFASLPFHTLTHTHGDGSELWKQFGVQCLAQRYFEMWTGETVDHFNL